MALLNIPKSDILTALGVDLEFELAIDDDPSGKVKRFINDIQEWCCPSCSTSSCPPSWGCLASRCPRRACRMPS